MSETEQLRTSKTKDRLTVAGCIIMDGNKVLLLHRIKTDWYELPGGKVNREKLKKTGLDVK